MNLTSLISHSDLDPLPTFKSRSTQCPPSYPVGSLYKTLSESSTCSYTRTPQPPLSPPVDDQPRFSLPSISTLLESIDSAVTHAAKRQRTSLSAYRDLDSRPQSQTRLPGNAAPGAAGRGPSPILPSIRDLQSIHGPPHLDAFVLQEYRAGAVSPTSYNHTSLSGPMSDRRGADPYPGNCVSAPMHNQSPYPSYPSMIQSNSEQVSPQLLPQQSNSKNKRRQGNLLKPVTDILRAWFHEHLDHPYPSKEDKQMFMTRTGLTISQINNWFMNARRRHRNQMRNGASDLNSQRQSPFSDMDQTPAESPHQFDAPNKY